jgi:hypothetical protein
VCRDGAPFTGGTSAILIFPSVKTSDEGTHWVEIRSGAVAVTSGTAHLTVKVPEVPFSILTQAEKKVSMAVGMPVRFSVVASGTAPRIYCRYHNGKDITGGTASSYNVGDSNETDSGI